MYFGNVLTKCFCAEETTHLITPLKGLCHRHCTGDFTSKSFRMWTKAAESQTHQSFTCRTPHNPILKTKLGLQVKGYDTAACNLFFFLQERQNKFSCNFISSRGVSRIQHNIKFLACLFNLRNCKNDDRWHMELTYVLYSLLKKGVQRNFEKGRSYSMQVALKIIQWLFGQLRSEHSGFLFLTFFKTNPHCCKLPLVITAPTFSALLSQSGHDGCAISSEPRQPLKLSLFTPQSPTPTLKIIMK